MTPPLNLHDVIRQLNDTKTHYRLSSVREGAVMLEVAVPGQRWEIEFFDNREPGSKSFTATAKFGPEKLSELRVMMAD